MEREFNEYDDWVDAGGQQGTGQFAPPPPQQQYTPDTPGAPPGAGAGTITNPGPVSGGGGKTPQQIEEEGRAYDAAHGYVGGYMMNGQWVNGSPTSSGGGGSDGFGSAGGFPGFNWRGFIGAAPFNPHNANFSYADYTPSSYSDLEGQPGYMEGEKRLQKQIMAEKAFQGMARSGPALQALWTGLDTNREQKFSEFDNRRFRNYSAGRQNALESFQTNYGVERDQYDRYAGDIGRRNDYQLSVDKAENDSILQRYLEQVRSLTSLSRPVDS